MIQWFLIGVLVMWCIAAIVDQLHDPYTFESRRPSSLPLDDNDRAARGAAGRSALPGLHLRLAAGRRMNAAEGREVIVLLDAALEEIRAAIEGLREIDRELIAEEGGG